MVQEFRYVASGALVALSLVMALAMNDSSGALRDWRLVALVTAIAAPLGWIQYQWHGFLLYRRGGLEAYRETRTLQAALDEAGEAAVDWVPGCRIPAAELRQRLGQLGEEYYARLGDTIGFAPAERPTRGAYALLHNLIFAGQPAHSFGGGRYGLHNMLAAFMWSLVWSGSLLCGGVLSWTLDGLSSSASWQVAALVALTAYAVAVLLARIAFRWACRPSPAEDRASLTPRAVFVASAPAGASLLVLAGLPAVWCVACGTLVVLAFLVGVARQTSAMLLLEAELFEDLMTWTRTYEIRSLAARSSTQPVP